MTEDDSIPECEVYRGVPVHFWNGAERVESIVKPGIDHVHGLSDPVALFGYACDVYMAPEARGFAAAKCRAAFDMAAEQRCTRPVIDMDLLRACVAGVDSRRWAHPHEFGSLLDVPQPPGSKPRAKRERPLTDEDYGRPPRRTGGAGHGSIDGR